MENKRYQDFPLSDIRVLDLSQFLVGPYGTRYLGDLGADVIKIEPPYTGDMTRKFAGPSVKGESAYFLSINRNKRSITLNLKEEKGKEIFLKLVEKADIVFENFRPDVMDRLGLGYEKLREVNPKIIYCAVTGFGQYGPYIHKPGFDPIVQALGGLMSIVGEPGRPPIHTGLPIIDLVGGPFALIGVLSALHQRERTGKGQFIDLSMLDLTFALLAFMGQFYLVAGEIPTPVGSGHATNTPIGAFKTKDNYIQICCPNQNFWEKLAKVLSRVEGYENLPKDAKFSTPAKRLENRKSLFPLLAEIFSKKTGEEWLRELEEADVPVAPINTIDKVFADPQINSRNMIVEFDHPIIGKMKTMGNPIKMSGIKEERFGPPPLLSQHTDEILKDMLGYSEREIEELKEEGVF